MNVFRYLKKNKLQSWLHTLTLRFAFGLVHIVNQPGKYLKKKTQNTSAGISGPCRVACCCHFINSGLLNNPFGKKDRSHTHKKQHPADTASLFLIFKFIHSSNSMSWFSVLAEFYIGLVDTVTQE